MLELANLLEQFRQQGYPLKIYTQGNIIKFVRTTSRLHHKPFLLQVHGNNDGKCKKPDYILSVDQCDYKTYRQRECLGSISLDNVCCYTGDNLCVKNNDTFLCYNITNFTGYDAGDGNGDVDDSDDLDNYLGTARDSNVAAEDDGDKDGDGDGDDKDGDGDIEIDDHPITHICPVFDISQFSVVEDAINQAYETIYVGEEALHEIQLDKLVSAFELQKTILKTKMFETHKDTFNIHAELRKCGEQLTRLNDLKDRSANEPNRVRIKIDRLLHDLTEEINFQHEKLSQRRQRTSKLMRTYWEYLELFNSIDF